MNYTARKRLGTLVQMSAAQPFTVNEVREALDKEGLGNAEIQPVKGTRELVIKLKKSEESVGQISENLAGILNKSLTGNHFEVIGKSEISASIGQYLRNKALIAITISMVCIILYIACCGRSGSRPKRAVRKSASG